MIFPSFFINFGRIPSLFDVAGNLNSLILRDFQEKQYPYHKRELEAKKQEARKSQDGILEVETKGDTFSTYITKRTCGIVQSIEDNSCRYPSAAFMVKSKEKPISKIKIRTSGGIEGIINFPRSFSPSERQSIVNSPIAYQEKYSCYDEGGMLGLLQGWDYILEVLEGPNKGLKLESGVTV